MASEIKRVQINYTIGQFSDALYYDIDAYNAGLIPVEEIEAEKQIRYANWQYQIANPPSPPPEPTEEELLAAMEQQLFDLEMQLLALQGGL